MAQLKKILLVDDDEDLREALSEQLVMTEDFDVFEAGNGAEAMERAKEAIYDLVILDVGLPDTDGRELCRLMRKQGVKSPILMLTGHDSDADTILGLDAGARAVHVQARDEDADDRGRQENPPDRERDEYPQVPLPLHRWRGRPRCAFA